MWGWWNCFPAAVCAVGLLAIPPPLPPAHLLRPAVSVFIDIAAAADGAPDLAAALSSQQAYIQDVLGDAAMQPASQLPATATVLESEAYALAGGSGEEGAKAEFTLLLTRRQIRDKYVTRR